MDDFHFASKARGPPKLVRLKWEAYRGALLTISILRPKLEGPPKLVRPKWEVYRGALWAISILRPKLEGPPKLIRPKWGYIGVHYGQIRICVQNLRVHRNRFGQSGGIQGCIMDDFNVASKAQGSTKISLA